MPTRKLIACTGIMMLPLLTACSDEAEPRPQVVLFVDTRAPVVGQLDDGRGLSPDAAVDTLRIDLFDADLELIDSSEFVAPDPLDWPVSLGVVAETQRVWVRVRAFRGELADHGFIGDQSTLEPPADASIDRLVLLEPASEGVERLRIVLEPDCFGSSVSFVPPFRTCIDGSKPRGSALEGIETVENEPQTLVGSWELSREVPCSRAARAGEVCIPGGYLLMGSVEGAGVISGFEPLPRIPALMSPFFMDATEFTVGRLRQLFNDGLVSAEPPKAQPGDTAFDRCTWVGPSDPANDDLPVNCVTSAFAREVCGAVGGMLPTEAQWEHAARGRGEARRFPWGESPPECCTAHVGGVVCERTAPAPAGSYPGSPECGLGDVSRDGVFDLGGNLTELTSDRTRPYTDACWPDPSRGVAVDPSCAATIDQQATARGGDYLSGSTIAMGALRHSLVVSSQRGFRCVYPGGP